MQNFNNKLGGCFNASVDNGSMPGTFTRNLKRKRSTLESKNSSINYANKSSFVLAPQMASVLYNPPVIRAGLSLDSQTEVQ